MTWPHAYDDVAYRLAPLPQSCQGHAVYWRQGDAPAPYVPQNTGYSIDVSANIHSPLQGGRGKPMQRQAYACMHIDRRAMAQLTSVYARSGRCMGGAMGMHARSMDTCNGSCAIAERTLAYTSLIDQARFMSWIETCAYIDRLEVRATFLRVRTTSLACMAGRHGFRGCMADVVRHARPRNPARRSCFDLAGSKSWVFFDRGLVGRGAGPACPTPNVLVDGMLCILWRMALEFFLASHQYLSPTYRRCM